TGELAHVTTSGSNYANGVSGPVTVSMQYDVMDRKVSMSDPDKGNWVYAYNAFGELVEQINGRGQRTEIVYDRNGRIVSRTDVDSDGATILSQAHWSYDSAYGYSHLGKLIAVTSTSRQAGSEEVYWELNAYDGM